LTFPWRGGVAPKELQPWRSPPPIPAPGHPQLPRLWQHWQLWTFLDVERQLGSVFSNLPASDCHNRLGDSEFATVIPPVEPWDGLQFSYLTGSAAARHAALIHTPWSRERSSVLRAYCCWGPFKWYRELEQPRMARRTIFSHYPDAELLRFSSCE